MFSLPVDLGEMAAEDIRVELCADSIGQVPAEVTPLARGEPVAGAVNGFVYKGRAWTSRLAEHFTVRVVPHHVGVRVPSEVSLILWQRRAGWVRKAPGVESIAGANGC